LVSFETEKQKRKQNGILIQDKKFLSMITKGPNERHLNEWVGSLTQQSLAKIDPL